MRVKKIKSTKAWCVDDPHFPLEVEHVRVSEAKAEKHRLHGIKSGRFCQAARTIRVQITEIK